MNHLTEKTNYYLFLRVTVKERILVSKKIFLKWLLHVKSSYRILILHKIKFLFVNKLKQRFQILPFVGVNLTKNKKNSNVLGNIPQECCTTHL